MKSYLSLTPAEFRAKFKHCCHDDEFILEHETMAEAWDACEDVDWLLWAVFLFELAKGREKKLVKLACRFVRETPIGNGKTVWDLLEDESREMVEVAEAWIEGKATYEELNKACNDAARVSKSAAYTGAWSVKSTYAASAAFDVYWAVRSVRSSSNADAAYVACSKNAYEAARAARNACFDRVAYKKANQSQAPLIREMFGNPFFKS